MTMPKKDIESKRPKNKIIMNNGSSSKSEVDGNSSILDSRPETVEHVYSPEEKKLFKKINWITAPFVGLVMFLQYLDKVTLNYSAVMDLIQDTGLSGNQYSWLGTLYYAGYLSFLFPNQYFMHRFPLSKYLGVLLFLWGVTLALTALASNFSQLAALRFLLGFFESAAYPCIIVLITLVYRRSEQVVVIGIMPASTALGGVMGGVIGYGFLHMNGINGLSAWKWYMIILGSITSAMGVLVFIFLPDKARSRWYRLSESEQNIVEERMQDSAVVQQNNIKLPQIFESLKEFRLYCYWVISFLLNLLNGAMGIYTTLLIKNLGGVSDSESILLSIPASITAILLICIAVFLSKRFNEYGYVATGGCLVTVVGLILLMVIPKGGAILVGIFLSVIGAQSAIYLAMVSVNVSGYTKKTFYVTTANVMLCLGNFTGPLLMREEFAPRYVPAMSTFAVANLLSAVLFIYLRWSYTRDNQRRLQWKAEDKLPPPVDNLENADLTDKENLYYIYHP